MSVALSSLRAKIFGPKYESANLYVLTRNVAPSTSANVPSPEPAQNQPSLLVTYNEHLPSKPTQLEENMPVFTVDPNLPHWKDKALCSRVLQPNSQRSLSLRQRTLYYDNHNSAANATEYYLAFTFNSGSNNLEHGPVKSRVFLGTMKGTKEALDVTFKGAMKNMWTATMPVDISKLHCTNPSTNALCRNWVSHTLLELNTQARNLSLGDLGLDLQFKYSNAQDEFEIYTLTREMVTHIITRWVPDAMEQGNKLPNGQCYTVVPKLELNP